jgi:predicted nucleic acid-binding protein
LALIEQTKGELNFNDALIVIACRERRIPRLASFDADFDKVAWLKRVASAGDLSPGTPETGR